MPSILHPGEGRESWWYGGKNVGTPCGGDPHGEGAGKAATWEARTGEAGAGSEIREAGRPRSEEALRPGRRGDQLGEDS